MLGHVAGNSGKRKVAKGFPKVCENHGLMKATEKNPGNALRRKTSWLGLCFKQHTHGASRQAGRAEACLRNLLRTQL